MTPAQLQQACEYAQALAYRAEFLDHGSKEDIDLILMAMLELYAYQELERNTEAA